MKAIVVGIALCAAIGAPAAFAKPAYSHHLRHPGAHSTQSRHGATAPEKNTMGKSPGESGDVPFPETSGQGRDNSHAAKPNLKIVAPEISPANHNKVSEPRNTSIRNALGQPVEPMAGGKSETVPSPSVEKLQGMSSIRRRNAAPNGLRTFENTDDRPGVSPRPPLRSAIGGTGMIRRNVASSIGGPAKPAGAIDGTLIRPRHP